MPVELLTDEQVAAYGQFAGPLTRAQLERSFFLNDADRELVEQRRRDPNRLGFGVQLGTVRFLGAFLADPTDVPPEVAEYVTAQLGIADPACLKLYGQREPTHREHAGEIHLLLTDVVMPEMTGPELARHVSAQRPKTRVLFMTGYTERDPAGADALLHKPFSSSTLLGHVRRLLDSGSLKT